jgi:hypothetical protein
MVTTAVVLGGWALAMMVDNHHLTGRGWTLVLTGPHRRPGGASIRTGNCLGLLLVVMLIMV